MTWPERTVVTRGPISAMIFRAAGHESDTETEQTLALPVTCLVDWPRNNGNTSCDRG